MERSSVSYDYKLNKTLALLANPGLLLAATKRSGKSNVMTIGWGTVGIIWGKPIFTVLAFHLRVHRRFWRIFSERPHR